MKTTMNIPDDLMKKAMRASGARTKTETVLVALRELIRKKKIDRLLETAGSYDFPGASELERFRDDR
ncbi:MAG: type II toxin-antitoxin system VapB family antitoxin [Polyangia bacterium]